MFIQKVFTRSLPLLSTTKKIHIFLLHDVKKTKKQHQGTIFQYKNSRKSFLKDRLQT
jgi:hypothetical protein